MTAIKKNTIIVYVLMLLTCFCLSSCVDDNTDFSSYMSFKKISIVYNGAYANVTGDENGIVTVSGADVVVNSQVADSLVIEVSGNTSDGSLLIFRQEPHKLRLRLNGVSITNNDGPAINNQCGKGLYLEVVNGTINYLADGTEYAEQIYQQKGTLFSEGQIIVSGTGTLNVSANCQNAIASDDYIVIEDNVTLNTVTNTTGTNGIKVNDGFWMNSGMLSIDVKSDGGRGIRCDSVVVFNGGTTVISTSGDCVEKTIDDVIDYNSAACIRNNGQFLMTGGILTMMSTGDGGKGLNCDQEVVLSGGQLIAWTTGTKMLSKPRAVKGAKGIILSGGYFSAEVDEGWACDNGTDSENPVDRVTVIGSTVVQVMEKKKVNIVHNGCDTRIRTISLTYSGQSVSVTGDDNGYVTVSGADVIVDAGESRDSLLLILSGSSPDGSLLVRRSSSYGIKLNGVRITNNDGPAINNQCKRKLYLEVVDGTVNTLEDGAIYTEQAFDQKGTVFSEGMIEFSGSGSLEVTGNGKNAIACDDSITIPEGITIITHTPATGSNGIKAKTGMYVNGGILLMDVASAGGRGVRVNGAMEINGGTISITNSGGCLKETIEGIEDVSSAAGIKCDSTFIMSGGKLIINSTGDGGKGINNTQDIVVSGGIIDIKTSGDCYETTLNGVKDTTSAACIKGGMKFFMTGGTVTLNSSGDGGKGLNCDQDVAVSGGSFIAKTTGTNDVGKPKAVKSTTAIIVSGGSFEASTNKSWACDNGSDSSTPANRLTIVGTPMVKSIAQKLVRVIFE